MTAVFPIMAIAAVIPVGAAAAGAAPAAQAPLTASEAQALSANVTDKVIVVFKNQLTATPETATDESARNAAVASVQSPVVHELTMTQAQNVKSFQIINALSATVSPGEAARLAGNPDVAEVVKDEPIPVASSSSLASAGAGNVPTGASTGSVAGGSLKDACLPSPEVQLDPEAVETIHAASQSGNGANAQALGYTGAGVTVGFIADGLDIKDPDFIRADGKKVFVDYQDFSGTGTRAPTNGAEAFLDASSIAAQGLKTYDVSGYGAGLPAPCLIRVLGAAPGASLVGLNVFGSSNIAFNSVFLEAINYAVSVDHVNVLNESFGSNPFPDAASLDLTRMADDAAVAAGVTVTVSTGDAGPTNTIGSPATDPAVISAGATTTYRAYAQTGIAGINLPGVKGWLDDNISGLSSGGFAQDGTTVDVVAPGDLNWALCSPPLRRYGACSNFSGRPSDVELQGGTSEASPLTAGTAALVIQAYAEAHGGTDPTPAVVKRIITGTATDINAPGDQQGAGLIDAYAAVLAARSYPGATDPARGDALLKSANQLNAVGQPSTTETLGETVTNDGKATATVGLSSRTLGTYTSVASTAVTLDPSTGDAAEVQFTVPSGQGRLNASIAYDIGAGLSLSLFTPNHKLAEYNLPQGAGNYGNAQVADPAAGTWTALVFGAPGTVQFGASVAPWVPFGTLSASSLTLAPGASAPVTLTVATPGTPGDQAGSIVLTDAAAAPAFTGVTTVPVTLRSLVPTPAPSTTFTGTLTGGNGRGTDTGQTAYYQFDVPTGLAAVNADISTADATNTFMAELVDPTTGQSASTAVNSHIETGGGGLESVLQDGAQLHVLDPAPGVWTLIIDFYNAVSGTAVSQPFTVILDAKPAVALSTGLPDSAATTLAAGIPVTADVTVTNTGDAPESYFVDGRLDQSTTIDLASTTGSTVEVPLTGQPPEFVVPSHTTTVTASASASTGIFFDYSQVFGDPDLISVAPPFGTNPTGTFTSPAVADGVWAITPFQDGPDGRHGVAPVTTQTAMTATTAAFDPALRAPTGDFWLESVDPTTTVAPVVVDPGQTVTIPVDITPGAAPGTTVSGTLYLDDASLISGAVTENALFGEFPQGSDVASFPYEYTVG
ncbi:MAG TPA: protease inhibitor I9 family protein [Acidimicrobiales bacterium]|nr:protease inhibitor I9 family protein [Acidimicrobiales bacterium]